MQRGTRVDQQPPRASRFEVNDWSVPDKGLTRLTDFDTRAPSGDLILVWSVRSVAVSEDQQGQDYRLDAVALFSLKSNSDQEGPETGKDEFFFEDTTNLLKNKALNLAHILEHLLPTLLATNLAFNLNVLQES